MKYQPAACRASWVGSAGFGRILSCSEYRTAHTHVGTAHLNSGFEIAAHAHAARRRQNKWGQVSGHAMIEQDRGQNKKIQKQTGTGGYGVAMRAGKAAQLLLQHPEVRSTSSSSSSPT